MPTSVAQLVVYLQTAAPAAAVLACFVTVIAYIHSARLKVLVFSLPIPFTCAYIVQYMTQEQRINATHLSGLLLSAVYHWLVYGLRVKWKLPLLVCIGVSVLVFVGSAMVLRGVSSWPFLLSVAGFYAIWWAGVRWYRPVHEEGQRASAPWPIKLAGIFVLALGIFTLTDLLAGAVTTFPYAGVFTSYEMRRCLRTLAGQYLINIAAFANMMVTIWFFQTIAPLPGLWALAPGWVVLALSLWAIYAAARAKPQAVAVTAGDIAGRS